MSSIYPFSERTLSCLHRAGWTPDYRFDPVPYLRFLAEFGFPVHDAASEFFNCFGGLVIDYVDENSGPDQLCFDILNHGWQGLMGYPTQQETVIAYKRIIGEAACYIGEASNGMLRFFVDEGSQYYVEFPATEIRCGSRPHEFIENILGGQFPWDWDAIMGQGAE